VLLLLRAIRSTPSRLWVSPLMFKVTAAIP
jgi:hypothetical protein